MTVFELPFVLHITLVTKRQIFSILQNYLDDDSFPERCNSAMNIPIRHNENQLPNM